MVISRKYEVVGNLGQGGMGLVYKVRHTRLETISALKVLPAYLMDNQDMVNRFYREARVMARLNHPNIVRVLDIERDETLNLFYFVMEYIEGVTLGKYIRDKGPLPLAELFGISRQVAEALGYAHNHTPPIIHRDIKPANIMIEDRSSRVVVMDFGIAKELGDGDSTKTGMVIGTLKYASPEQLRHEQLDGGADVYSLGMVMYEMYTGKQFFGGLEEHEVLRRVLYDNKENEPHFDRPPPAAFADLLTHAIAKSRTRRYPGMRELLQALEACRSLSAEGDETGTLILPGPEREETKNKEAPADDDLERQIRELEEERQRRRIVPLQTQARDARERAAREGAADWAATLLQQGLTSEERGAKSLQERDFTAAQQAFEEAIQIFARAEAAAQTAAAKRKAEQARDNMAATKEEAEHYGARDHAPTRYTRGLALQSQADDLLENNDFQYSAQVYSEAARFFAEAREIAYRETVKEEAENARARVVAAKAAAEEIGAAQFAANLFREAVDQEQRANAAIVHEEFTQARELFLAAAQKYEHAQQQAQIERQHQETLASQQQTIAAQRHADAVNASELASLSYQQAVIFHKQGDTQLQAQAYEKATRAYERARDRYARATEEAELEQEKQQTVAVHQQLQQAQAQADHAGAKERMAAMYTAAQRLVTQGQENEKQQKYSDARDCYTEAAQRFQQLAREAAVLAARERADVAQQEMTATMQGSELQTWAKASWTIAQERAQQAGQAYQKQEYEHAAELYVQATQEYIQARADAEREQLQHEIHNAQQQAQLAKSEAEKRAAARYAAELWRDGLAAQKDAEQQIRAKNPRAAIQRYWRAAELLTKASETAQHERRKQEAAIARQRAEEARRIAEQTGAAQRFAADFSQASQFVEQATQAEARLNFPQAVDAYQHAFQLWERLGGEAVREAEREKAGAARARVAEARNELAGLEEWRATKWAEAERIEAEANATWEAQRYAQATEAYDQVAQLYKEALAEVGEARHAAEVERQRQRALDVRQQAEDVHAEAVQAEAETYAGALFQRASQAMQKAEQHLRGQRWNDAGEAFFHSRSLWSQAVHDAQQEKARQAAVAFRQRLEAARTAAEEAEANTRFAQEFASAQRRTEQGQQAEMRQDFAQATSLYEQALQQWLRLRREADVQAAREEAETAHQQMLRAKEQASVLKQWAKAQWDTAQKHEADAQRRFAVHDYKGVLAQYTQATQLYSEVAVAGERERLRQDAIEAEKQTVTAKKKAEEVDALRYAATEFNQGVTAIAEAGRHQQQQEFIEAIRLYRSAEELFARSTTTAQRTQAKQQAVNAQQRADDAASAAARAGAEWRFPQEFAQARSVLEHGYTAQEREDFVSARHDYDQAQQQFVKLVQAVQQHLAREQADVVRQQASQAKQEADLLAPRFAVALWKEALGHEAEGERAWKAQAYEQARLHYERAAQSYVRARTEAEAEERRQRAVAASQEAQERQKEADAVHALQYAGEPYRRAQTVKEQADAAVATKKFDDAVALFAQASALFQNAMATAKRIQVRQTATVAREKAMAVQAEAQAARGEEFLPDQYVEAMSLLHVAEQAFTSEKFDEAREQFDRIAVRWQQIRQESEVAQQKQEAEAARTRAHRLREQTRSKKGKQKKQAEKTITAGDQFLQQRRYSQAQVSYEQASALLSALQQQEVTEEQDTLIEPSPPPEKRVEVRPDPASTSTLPRQSTPLVAGVAALVVAAALMLYFSGAFQPSKPLEQITTEQTKLEQVEAERLKAEQLKAQQAEAERLKAEQTKAERLKAEQVAKAQQAEADRLKAEQAAKAQQAEAERLKAAQAKAEADRLKAEQVAKAQQAEADRLKLEQAKAERAEADRLKLEQAKADRLKAEQAAKAQQAEADRLKLEQAKAERAEADRLKAEQAAQAQKERERLAAEQAAQKEKERLAAEQAAQAQKERERLAAEQAAQKEQERLALATAPPKGGPPSDQEAKNWLETTYREAWESKNIDLLVQFGATSSTNAAKLKDVLDGYKSYRVSFKDVNIRNEGNRTIVQFIKVETIDGRTLSAPVPTQLKLEKVTGGRIAARQ